MDVVDDEGETVGSVVVGVPLDDELADRLARAAGLLEMDVLAIADAGETLAASGALRPGAALPAGEQGTTEQNGEDYRFVSTPLLEGTDVSLAALSSEAPVSAAVDDTQRRAFYAALATVGLALLARPGCSRGCSGAAPPRRRPRRTRRTSGGGRATSAAEATSSAFARPWRSSARRSRPRTIRRRCSP